MFDKFLVGARTVSYPSCTHRVDSVETKTPRELFVKILARQVCLKQVININKLTKKNYTYKIIIYMKKVNLHKELKTYLKVNLYIFFQIC